MGLATGSAVGIALFVRTALIVFSLGYFAAVVGARRLTAAFAHGR